MGESKITLTFSETKRDFRNAWTLLKDNYRAFLSTEIFAGIAFLITTFLTSLLVGTIASLITSAPLREVLTNFSSNFVLSHIVRIGIMLICMWIFFGFLNCQFGIAHEIMSSGEMYAEFKSSFGYYKKFWWQYPILTFVIMAATILMPLKFRFNIFVSMNDEFFAFLVAVIFFFWFIIFISTLPSVTFQGNFKHAFIESLRMVKNDFRRLFFTWSIFFLVFFAPGFLIVILSIITSSGIFYIISFVYTLVLAFVGFPFMSLLATGLYKNVEIKRFKPLIEQ